MLKDGLKARMLTSYSDIQWYYLPDIFTFLQYRQADGTLFLCVFFCSLVPILFAVQFPLWEPISCYLISRDDIIDKLSKICF